MSDNLSLDEIIKKKKIQPFKNQNTKAVKTTKGNKATNKRLGKNRQLKTNATKKPIFTDARNRIIQRKRSNIVDARDRLGELARQGDARDRLDMFRQSDARELLNDLYSERQYVYGGQSNVRELLIHLNSSLDNMYDYGGQSDDYGGQSDARELLNNLNSFGLTPARAGGQATATKKKKKKGKKQLGAQTGNNVVKQNVVVKQNKVVNANIAAHLATCGMIK